MFKSVKVAQEVKSEVREIAADVRRLCIIGMIAFLTVTMVAIVALMKAVHNDGSIQR
jgi:hypothetical protein